MNNTTNNTATETVTIRRYNCINGWYFVTLPVYTHRAAQSIPVSTAVAYQRARSATAAAHNAWDHAVKAGIGQDAARETLDAAVAAERAAYVARFG